MRSHQPALVLPRSLYRVVLEQLVEKSSEAILLRLGRQINDLDGRTEWLGRNVASRDDLARAGSHERFLAVQAHDGHGPLPYIESNLDRHLPAVAAELFLGVKGWLGRAWGFARAEPEDGCRHHALIYLALPGPGMEVLPLLASGRGATSPDTASPAPAADLWPRTRGALGPGEAGARGLRRLHALRVALCGAGRSGGLFAEWLVRTGVGEVTLLDPDVLEAANLGESSALLTVADAGRSKAEVMAERLLPAARAGARILGLPVTLNSPAGMAALRRSDLIVTCCDHDGPRLAAALAATVHIKPHLDLGTGIGFDADGVRRMGCDVRLTLGDGRGCLGCLGGFASYREAVEMLMAPPAIQRAWREHRPADDRAGSLRSLNAVAVGVAARLLEDLVCDARRVEAPRWLRLEWGEDGALEARHPQSGETGGRVCAICRRAGEGDGDSA